LGIALAANFATLAKDKRSSLYSLKHQRGRRKF